MEIIWRKITCIYIDPPYNTGNENWIYNDNVNDPKMKKWLGEIVGKEGEDLSRHDKWLCMMYPRLRLLHKLLSEEGVIFISIDDNEIFSLKLMCDEIFGGNCFVNSVSWQRTYSMRNDSNGIPSEVEYILVYSKKSDWNPKRLPRTEEMDSKYKNPDNDEKGAWQNTSAFAPGAATHQGMVYAIQHPFTGKMLYPSNGACWRYSQEAMLEYMNGWTSYCLVDLHDEKERADICGLNTFDIRKGIQAIVLEKPLEIAKEEAERVYKRGNWPRFYFTNGGIPKEQIAIKTADVNELKGVDLLRSDCPIRYIITINALKEGWDCPFAYILASIANRTSPVEVEQIVGRVLRQPYTKKHSQKALNVSYVLTSSADFRNTLDNIVSGLNSAGFTDKDYRVGETVSPEAPNMTEGNQTTLHFEQREDDLPEEMSFEPAETEECLEFDAEALRKDIEQRNENIAKEEYDPATIMISNAEAEHDAFEAAIEEAKNEGFAGSSWEEREFMTYFNMASEFEEEASHIRIPQFCIKVEESLFVDGYEVKLKKEHLDETFSLKGKPYDIDFSQADRQMVAVDVRKNSENRPKVFQMNESDQRAMKELFSKYSSEQKVKTCKDIIHRQVNKMDAVDSRELTQYIDLIVDQMDNDALSALEKAPQGFAVRIRSYIEKLMEEHRQRQFKEWLEVGKITCQPMYEFKKKIAPLHSTSTFGRSLYQAEEEVNDFEYEMVMVLTGLDNIKWWHRNISRQEFCINGFINHYPDFIVMTKSGKILMIETKGDHLENRETKDKLIEGRAWQNLAGALYRYFLVFKSKDLDIEGAYQFDRFIETLKQL